LQFYIELRLETGKHAVLLRVRESYSRWLFARRQECANKDTRIDIGFLTVLKISVGVQKITLFSLQASHMHVEAIDRTERKIDNNPS
jgi:hypothetical protein